MEGFSSPPRRGLLLFEAECSENLAKADLKPRFTPMIWCLKRILGFGLKKEKKKIRKKYFLFLLYFERLILFPLKENGSKREIHFQN